MKNLAQLRAIHAKEWAPNVKKGNGDGKPSAVAKKVPAQIIQNGILGALAFALEDNEGPLSVFKGVAQHFSLLKDDGFDFRVSATDPEKFFDQRIKEPDPAVLRAITTETMEYLNYLRRFVK